MFICKGHQILSTENDVLVVLFEIAEIGPGYITFLLHPRTDHILINVLECCVAIYLFKIQFSDALFCDSKLIPVNARVHFNAVCMQGSETFFTVNYQYELLEGRAEWLESPPF